MSGDTEAREALLRPGAIAQAAERGARALYADLSDRSGWKWELEKTQPSVLEGEILPKWRGIIAQAIREAAGLRAPPPDLKLKPDPLEGYRMAIAHVTVRDAVEACPAMDGSHNLDEHMALTCIECLEGEIVKALAGEKNG